MASIQKEYKIHFGIEIKTPKGTPNQQNKENIPINNVSIYDEFPFFDYDSNSTIEYLKEYFMTTFSKQLKKYNLCKCVLSVFFKNHDKFTLLSNDLKKKLSEFKHDKLYVIKTNSSCDCEFKMYSKYMNMKKFDVIAELKAAKEKLNELEEYDKELKKLENENDLLKKTEEIKDDKDSKMEKFYDIVICINSMKSINKEGWEVKFNENGRKKYESHKNKESLIIGVLGNNNKGKSFLLSKLSKIKLLSGTSINTEGLSVKYPDLKKYKKRNLILLDSAGLETPVLKKINNNENQIEIEPDNNEKEIEQNKEFKENARDKIMTELFLQNFIIKVSEILLIVVGKLTYSEQLLINKIKVESKKQDKGRIFIIHNLQEFRAVEQVQDYIKNTLLKCSTFDLVKRTWISTQKNEDNNEEEEDEKEIKQGENNNENNDDKEIDKDENDESKLVEIHFNEVIHYGDKKKLEIHHLILANEYSEAGNVYNHYAYNFIEYSYNLITERKKFDIFDQVKEKFQTISPIILNDDIKEFIFTENEKILEEKKIKLSYEKDLTLKKCFTDELGFSFFKTGDFEPKYNYFKPDEHTLEVRVEVPGNSKCYTSQKITGDEVIITIYGQKKIDKTPKNPEDVIKNLREFSDYEVNIPLKVQDYEITKPKEGFPKFLNGVYCIQYELARKIEPVGDEQEGL